MTVTTTLEPKGKLGATTVANRPEDDCFGWGAVGWRAAGETVRRLRQRIFTAAPAGDLKRVRNLQKLMLGSRSSALVSVRRVTEVNAGRRTAGIDGEVALTPKAKADLAGWVQHRAEPWVARPVRRVYILKSLLIKGAGGARRSRLESSRRNHSATALATIGQRG
jgi:RNA-directed DNA polymerase